MEQNNFPWFLTKDFELNIFLDQYSQPQEDLNSELDQVLKYFRIEIIIFLLSNKNNNEVNEGNHFFSFYLVVKDLNYLFF